jgi:LysR family glycine cleavage system transcriptional activator
MKFPPLYALLCFEATGRHASMKSAAGELFVTPAAISQQIAKLEKAVGVTLFIRNTKRLELTPEGKIYLRAIRPALGQISDATQRLMSDNGPNTITVSCTSGFAMQWLLPRLPDFQAICPGIEVLISTTNRLVDLLGDGVDFAVRHGLGRYPGLEVEMLINDRLQPVCAPSLLPESRFLSSPIDLKNYTLLHDEHREDWALWLRAVGIEDAEAAVHKGSVFVDSNGVIEAALAGMGIALVRRSLVREELASGRLVVPFRATIDTPIAYYLVYDETAILPKSSRQFRDWLVSQAIASQREFTTR